MLSPASLRQHRWRPEQTQQWVSLNMSTTDGKGDLNKQADFLDRATCDHDVVYLLNIRNSNKNMRMYKAP